jgi:Fic family protein
MDSEKISGQLDTIIALLKMTNRDKLEAARGALDDVAKALLDAAGEPLMVGQLKKDVASKTGQSEKTVQRRIAELTDLGVLVKSGGGNAAKYRASGLL